MKVYEGNSNQKQLYDNTKEIELLKQEIAPWWKSTVALNDSDTSIAISSTNAPVATERGFLLDPNGKLFKITAGDGTTLLLEFYSKLTITQESGGDTPVSGGGIEIKYDAKIGFSDNYPLMAGDFIEGKGYSFILIAGTASSTEGISYTHANISSSSYYAKCALFEYYRKLGKGTLHFEAYSSSNPVLCEPTLVPFTDNEGNERVGFRGVYHTGGSAANARAGVLSFGSITINICVGRTYINEGNITCRPTGHINAKVLIWNLDSNSYEVKQLAYDYAATSDNSISTGNAYCLNASYRLNPRGILVGIFDIDCDLDIGINYEEV